MTAEKDANVHALLAGDAHTALAWLKTVNLKTITEDSSDFNWLAIASGANTLAHVRTEKGRLPEAEAWAQISCFVYEQLAAHSQNGIGFEVSAMNLRGWMIAHLGAESDHPLRDPSLITRWFLQTVSMSFEEAERSATALRRVPVDQWQQHFEVVRSLHAVKERLRVLRNLSELVTGWSPPPEIQRWLQLKELLP